MDAGPFHKGQDSKRVRSSQFDLSAGGKAVDNPVRWVVSFRCHCAWFLTLARFTPQDNQPTKSQSTGLSTAFPPCGDDRPSAQERLGRSRLVRLRAALAAGRIAGREARTWQSKTGAIVRQKPLSFPVYRISQAQSSASGLWPSRLGRANRWPARRRNPQAPGRLLEPTGRRTRAGLKVGNVAGTLIGSCSTRKTSAA